MHPIRISDPITTKIKLFLPKIAYNSGHQTKYSGPSLSLSLSLSLKLSLSSPLTLSLSKIAVPSLRNDFLFFYFS